MTKHAVFATCTDKAGEHATFRVGQAVDWHRAQDRWSRLYPLLVTARDYLGRAAKVSIGHGRVRYNRRWYYVDFMEVRAVDRHGRGLGSERHERAIPVPYLAFARA